MRITVGQLKMAQAALGSLFKVAYPQSPDSFAKAMKFATLLGSIQRVLAPYDTQVENAQRLNHPTPDASEAEKELAKQKINAEIDRIAALEIDADLEPIGSNELPPHGYSAELAMMIAPMVVLPMPPSRPAAPGHPAPIIAVVPASKSSMT